jgi:hypothetical protein
MSNLFPLKWSELLSLAGAASLVFTFVKEGTGKPKYAIIAGLSIFFVLGIVWSISRIWAYSENRFKLVITKMGEEAEDANEGIGKSEELVQVTYFMTSLPTPVFTAGLLHKMTGGVSLVRIVGENTVNTPEVNEWLKNFRPSVRYTEYVLKHIHLPFDFVICDNHKVILYLPTHAQSKSYKQALVFDNAHVASGFKAIFERLTSEAELTWDGGKQITQAGRKPV